jgi:hypothetical protein
VERFSSNAKRAVCDFACLIGLGVHVQYLHSTIREGNRLRVYGNRVLKILFGPKREEVARYRRRLRNEELHNLYISQNIVRLIKSGRMRWERHVEVVGEMRNGNKIMVGKLDEKRPLGKT